MRRRAVDAEVGVGPAGADDSGARRHSLLQALRVQVRPPAPDRAGEALHAPDPTV